jgi:hypothetical protein
MFEDSGFPLKALLSKKGGAKEPSRLGCPEYVKALFAAGESATHTGICLLDTQTRFDWVNAALAKETRATVDQHIGKTSREIVGDLATQIEPIYETVLGTGKRHPSGWRVMCGTRSRPAIGLITAFLSSAARSECSN